MPPSVDTPVQIQLGLRGVLGNGKNGSGRLCNRHLGRRRIFVQADCGSVLGIELDRADNVQTVKKKMQAVLNVPSEQTSLVFGDVIFESDLSKLRDHSPLLLTREIHRSLSTPCISPTVDKQVHLDGGQPLEVVGGLDWSPEINLMIEEIVHAINLGMEPIPASGGLGGAYFFRNLKGENVAIVKPTDEEPFAPNNPKGFVGKSLGRPGLKKAVRVGETGIREVAAYLLDHEHFAKVPPTVLVKVSHPALHVNGVTAAYKGSDKACFPVAKLASCQQFVPHDFDASDHGTSRFSVSAVHRIGILDIRIFNTDRHAGNILIRSADDIDGTRFRGSSLLHVNDVLELIPIDHGLCLPEALEDPYFEWLHWPQASLPFSEDELNYIQRLEEDKDVEILREQLPMLREACFRVLVLSTTLLKKAAAAGLCLAEIGEMMTRGVMGEASLLEMLCIEARFQVEKELLAESVADGWDDNSAKISPRSYSNEPFDFGMDNGAGSSEKQLSETAYNGACQVSQSTSKVSNLSSPTSVLDAAINFATKDVIGNHACESSTNAPTYMNNCSIPKVSSSQVKPPEINPSRSESPKDRFPERNIANSPRLKTAFCPLLEDVEANFSVKASSQASVVPHGFAYLPSLRTPKKNRSLSFGSNQKQRHSDGAKRDGPVSERTGMAYEGCLPAFSLGEFNREEWFCFMDHFGRLLQNVLDSRSEQNANQGRKLGISCQF